MIRDYIGRERKYHLRRWVKASVVVLTAVMLTAVLGVMPRKPQTVEAEVGEAQVKNVNLGTFGINDPDVPADQSSPWSGSFVYFGVHNGIPIKFRVLDASTQDYNADGDDSTYTMFLDCDNVLEERVYGYSNDSGVTDLECYLNSERITYGGGRYDDYTTTGFLTSAFRPIERGVIVKSTRAAGTSGYGLIVSKPLTGQKIFCLDISEVLNKKYGYFDDTKSASLSKVTLTGAAERKAWWLRSKGSQIDYYNGFVSNFGTLGQISANGARISNVRYSPAMNIDLSSVAFVTAAGSGKATSFKASVDAVGNDTWNLTINGGNGFKAEKKSGGNEEGTVAKGSKITVTVTEVPRTVAGSEYTQISAMLTDAAGTVLAYGKVADSAQVGDIEITIPVDMEGGEHSLKVFAETVNSALIANSVDYASNMVDIPLYVVSDIASVEVTGVTAPKAGEELDKSAMCADSRVVTTTLGWKVENDEVSGTAGYSKVYTACATLTASEGYGFTDSTVATVNGNTATYTKLNDDGTLTVAYTFPETEPEQEVIPPVIKLAVNVPEFAEVSAGYNRPEAKAVNITNIGNTDAVIVSVTVDNTEAFEVLGEGSDVPAGGAVDTWLIQPKAGLVADTYVGVVTVTYNEQRMTTANIKFTVNNNKITLVEITDVSEPKAGKQLDKTAVCATEGVATKTPEVFWQIKEEVVQKAKSIRISDNQALYNRQYVLSVTIAAEEGYDFADGITATVNGDTAARTELNDDGTLKVIYTFAPTEKGVMDKPDITIDYVNEVLLGFETDGIYTVNGNTVEVAGGKTAIEEGWFGTEVSIVRKSHNGDYTDSQEAILNIPERPKAPDAVGMAESVYGHRDGSITGVAANMEYRLALPKEWSDCRGEIIDNLAPGIYEVRVKATASSFVGISAKVEIKAGVYTGTVNVINGEGSGTYVAGNVITIKAATAPEGMKFKGWTVVLGNVKLNDVKNATTTLVVPIGEVQIKAEYESIKQQEVVQEPESEEEQKENEAPATGDSLPILWLVVIMIATGTIVAGIVIPQLSRFFNLIIR